MKPEMRVRQLVHSLGYRYRLHTKDLPGKPDLVFRPRRKVIFVHGCFWHQHETPDCPYRHIPTSNLTYWKPKLERNVERDKQQQTQLLSNGWRVLIVWECETDDIKRLKSIICKFLGPPKHNPSENLNRPKDIPLPTNNKP